MHSAAQGFVCGRIRRIDSKSVALTDESGTAEILLKCRPAGIGVGDIVEVAFEDGRALSIRLLARAVKNPSGNADFQRFDPAVKSDLRLRARLIAEIRRFFAENGFLEIETPSLVASPGLEPHLRAFATEYLPDSTGKRADGPSTPRVFLPTSPEHHMKRLLAAGFEKIFQVCRSYRNGESFHLHNPEFTMLEWYRAYADGDAIMADLEQLGAKLAAAANEARGGNSAPLPAETILFRDRTIDFAPPWLRITVHDAFRTIAGIELPPENDAEALRRAARAADVPNIAGGDNWEDAFYKVFLTAIEPKLGAGKPTFLTEYPASMAALAKRKESSPQVAERFELYIGGVEIANGFTELNDPDEQRRRFISEQESRRQMGAPEHPVDERLLDALSIGMPPAGGVAVGIDRLVMILAGRQKIEDVIAFPFSHEFPKAAGSA